jgi:hypothetical protein
LKVSAATHSDARADQEFAELAAAAMVNLGSNSSGCQAQTCSTSDAKDAKEFKESPLMDASAPQMGSPDDAPVGLLD